VLVTGQRNGGAVSATLDAVLVRSDGWTRLDKRHRGAGRRYDDFHLSGDALRCPGLLTAVATGRGASYLLRHRGVTYYAVAGALPRATRPAIDALRAIIDGGGRSGHVTELTQGPA
jgi:hypothetical protein